MEKNGEAMDFKIAPRTPYPYMQSHHKSKIGFSRLPLPNMAYGRMLTPPTFWEPKIRKFPFLDKQMNSEKI